VASKHLTIYDRNPNFILTIKRYHLIDYCPFLWNNLGFPGFGWGPGDYFNRTDVKKAINADPDINYVICGDDNLGLDSSPPSALGPLPKVIEMTNNVIIGGGNLDYLLLTNGTLATIQSMYPFVGQQKAFTNRCYRHDMERQTRFPETSDQRVLRSLPSRCRRNRSRHLLPTHSWPNVQEHGWIGIPWYHPSRARFDVLLRGSCGT
jgi:hypothetical protein